MSEPWEKLAPNHHIQIHQLMRLDTTSWEVLTRLYLPIIGPDAYALFSSMSRLIPSGQQTSALLRHADLMNLLLFTRERYFKARRILEGIDLLRSFERKHPTEEIESLFLLQSPISSQQFFEDATMPLLLLEQVGEEEFEALRKSFIVSLPSLDQEEWTEVTANFSDAFRLPTEIFPLPDLKESETLIQDPPKESNLDLGKSDLDWPYFKELLKQNFIVEKAITPKLRKVTFNLNRLYGFNELTLMRLVKGAYNVRTEEVDLDTYEKLALESRPKNPPIQDRVSLYQQQQRNQNQKQKEQAKKEGLTEDQLLLIRQANAYPPVEFARSIKEQKGGTLTDREIQTLKGIIENGKLPSAVLNIMIHYYLVDQDNKLIYNSTFQSTENDWAQEKIQTPQQALIYLKKRKEKKKQTSKGNYQKKRYVEPTPEWLNQSQNQSQNQVLKSNPSNGQLKQLLKQNKGGKS